MSVILLFFADRLENRGEGLKKRVYTYNETIHRHSEHRRRDRKSAPTICVCVCVCVGCNKYTRGTIRSVPDRKRHTYYVTVCKTYTGVFENSFKDKILQND